MAPVPFVGSTTRTCGPAKIALPHNAIYFDDGEKSGLGLPGDRQEVGSKGWDHLDQPAGADRKRRQEPEKLRDSGHAPDGQGPAREGLAEGCPLQGARVRVPRVAVTDVVG